MENLVKKIEQMVKAELKEKYKDRKRMERVASVYGYSSLPITSAKNENELPIVIRDVIAVVKEKIVNGRDIIQTYEVYDESANKLLETTDEGRIKLDREILDDKLQDMIKQIKEAGYEPAGLNSINEKGEIDSFFQMINDKIMAINEAQKEKLENAENREEVLEDISKSTLDSQKAYDKEQELNNRDDAERMRYVGAERINSGNLSNRGHAERTFYEDVERINRGNLSNKNEMQKKNQDANAQNKNAKLQNKDEGQMKQELAEEGIDAVKITKEIEDQRFKLDNSHIEGARAVLTKDGRTEIVKEEDGKLKKAEGFKNSTSRTGETFVAWNDEEKIGDQVHTYGEIEGENKDKKYSITLDKYGDPELIEKQENRDGHMEQKEEYVSMGVHTKGDAYYKANREGQENSNNITERARDTRGTGKNAHYNGDGKGKGGIYEIANANKNHGEPKDYTMDDFSAHTNPKLDDALGKFHDELKKNGISLDPDVEANVEKRIAEYIEQSEKPFCDEEAKAYLMEAQIEMRAKEMEKSQEEETEEIEEDTRKDRIRADEAAEARRKRK